MEMEHNSILSSVGQFDESEINGKYLTFYSDRQLFALPISEVVQIVGMQTITKIPSYPAYAKGIINLRGSIIPVIDIRLRLGKAEADYTDRTCVIVTNIKNRFFGFIVDEVDEVTDIDEGVVSLPPSVSQSEANRYLMGIARLDERIVLLMDVAKILAVEELDELADPASI